MFELDQICTSMVFRATTRIGLEKSICSLMPKFSEQLVLSAMEDARETNCAVHFYDWVEREGLYKHTRATHMKAIERLVRSSKPNPARARGMVIGLPSKGVEWDEEMFVLLIEGYGKNRNVQESVKIFRAMKELGVERGVCSYDALFKVSLRHRKCLLAKKYYNQMLQEGIAPTRQTFNVLLWGFFRCQDEETAMSIHEEMMSRGIEPDVVTYNAMISGFIMLKKFEEAEKLFVEMKGKKIAPTVITYSSMIYCYFSSGKVKDAYRQYFEMMRAGMKPNGVTFTTLSSGRCNAMELPEAEVVSKEVLERSADPKDYSVFISLLNYMCRSGQFEEAVRVLRAMIRLNIPTEAGHYGILIENFCNTKGYDRAVKYVDELIEKGIILMPGSTLSKGRETKKADDLYRQLTQKDVQDSVAFNKLLRGDTKKVDRSDAYSRLSLFCEIYLVKRGVTDQKSIASVI